MRDPDAPATISRVPEHRLQSGIIRCRIACATTTCALALAGAAAAQVWELRNWASFHGSGQANEHFGAALATGNFNGDLYSDLVAGAPDWDKLDAPPLYQDTGAVARILGSAAGLVPPFVAQSLQTSGDFHHRGAALVAADFSSAQRTALIAGVPGRSTEADQGGGIDKYTPNADASGWSQESYVAGLILPGVSEPFDHFGKVLAVGRFDDDIYWDLAIGIPDENLESPTLALDAGEIMIIYGSATGLDRSTAHLINENTGSLGGAQANARFGSSLAAGDFNGDGYHDLAVGIPDRDVMSGTLQAEAGEVVILFGSAGGLTTTGHQRLSAASLSLVPAAGQHFGAALAAGDFNATILCLFSTCYADLAIGVPGWLDVGHPESGMVAVLDGGAAGLSTAGVDFLFQDLLGDGGSVPADFDRLGSVLVAGSLDGRIGVDLAIGVPDENVGANADQGMVHLVFGGPSGLRSYPGQFLVQRSGLASGPGAAGDRFGAALAAGKFDLDGHPDLAVGIPGRNAPGAGDAGMVQILYGALFADGFESGGTGYWN